MHRTISGLVCCLGIALGSAAGAGAQRPVWFLPGLNEDYSVWTSTAATVASVLDISPYTVSLPTDSAFSVQIGYLSGIDSSGIFVGHSNGGIAARMAARARTTPLYGIATLGTPNAGINLVNTFPDVISYFDVVGSDLFESGIVGFVDGAYSAPVAGALDAAGILIDIADDIMADYAYDLVHEIPAQEIAAGSTFIDTLLSGPGLSTEASIVTHRVNILTTAQNNDTDDCPDFSYDCGLWSIARGNGGTDYGATWNNIAYALMDLGEDLILADDGGGGGGGDDCGGGPIDDALHASDDGDYADAGYVLLATGYDMALLDSVWSEAISLGYDDRHDEFVSSASQMNFGTDTVPQWGPNHIEEPFQSAEAIITALNVRMLIPYVTAPVVQTANSPGYPR